MKIYVAGPYTGNTLDEIELNVRRAMEAGLMIWKKGHFPYNHISRTGRICAQKNSR